ncbi:ATP-binding protein [Marinobacter antarcticus]|nr:ATP-binding protein [Marinobacter antarcticus]
MGDRKKFMNVSLQFRLSFWLSCAIVAVAVVAGTFSFVTAFGEANELQDDILRQVAILADRHHATFTEEPANAEGSFPSIENRVFIKPLGRATPHDRVTPELPSQLSDGFQDIQLHDRSYRIYVKTLKSGTRVAVGQEVAVRDEIARDGALRTLLPFLILMPILLLLARDIIKKMFRPLSRLAKELDESKGRTVSALPETDLPEEIRPFVVAINRLFARVAESVSVQRRFIADAAHELRTPLTALSLQAERLNESEMSSIAHKRSNDLRGGIQRTRHLVDQLLTYTRVQDYKGVVEPGVMVNTSLQTLLEDLFPLAQSAGIDLGVGQGGDLDAYPDLWVSASETELNTVLTNLVMNAIHYTPRGGEVDLDAREDGTSVLITVSDTGPGIPLEERERVFDPFYRILGTGQPGSGLGLSIVKSICDRLNASIRLDYANAQRETGLMVSIRMPKS